MNRALCVMNPWSRAEIHKITPAESLTTVDEIFDELGPTPRLCFGNTIWLPLHRTGLEAALDGLTLGFLEKIPSLSRTLALDAVSHKMYMLKRRLTDTAVYSVDLEIMPITPSVASKIAARMRTLQRYELVDLFNRYHAMPSTKIMSGKVFESYWHLVFSKKITFDFVPMVRMGGPTTDRRKTEIKWHSSHTEFPKEFEALEAQRHVASSRTESLNIVPSRHEDYSTGKQLHVEAGVYYIPLETNQVGIDSFILKNDILYLFQMTTAIKHDINDKLAPFIRSLTGVSSKESDWCFIFIKPPRHILTCPVPYDSSLRKVVLCSAEVEMRSAEEEKRSAEVWK